MQELDKDARQKKQSGKNLYCKFLDNFFLKSQANLLFKKKIVKYRQLHSSFLEAHEMKNKNDKKVGCFGQFKQSQY